MLQKRSRIVYWVATVWLSLGMVSTGIVQVMQIESEVDFILKLGYPPYFLTLLGVAKFLGVVAVLIPKFPLLKEWAYAGFFFMMSGAIYSHIAMSNPVKDIFPPLLLLLLTMTSWYFRPPGRKTVSLMHN